VKPLTLNNPPLFSYLASLLLFAAAQKVTKKAALLTKPISLN
jgi:hypothetical protein